MAHQSSNSFARGADQNCGNFLTEKRTTKVLNPPGGKSSFSLAWGSEDDDRKPARGGRGQVQGSNASREGGREFDGGGGYGGGQGPGRRGDSGMQDRSSPGMHDRGPCRGADGGGGGGYDERGGDDDRRGGDPGGSFGARPARTSSNAYASGSMQNSGNFLTDTPTTRVLAPPGGKSSFSLGWDQPEEPPKRGATRGGGADRQGDFRNSDRGRGNDPRAGGGHGIDDRSGFEEDRRQPHGGKGESRGFEDDPRQRQGFQEDSRFEDDRRQPQGDRRGFEPDRQQFQDARSPARGNPRSPQTDLFGRDTDRGFDARQEQDVLEDARQLGGDMRGGRGDPREFEGDPRDFDHTRQPRDFHGESRGDPGRRGDHGPSSRGGYDDSPPEGFRPDDRPPPKGGGKGGPVTHGTRSRVSGNSYASGAQQNCGNVMTDHPSTRVMAPPGGSSSISLGWDYGESPDARERERRDAADRQRDRVRGEQPRMLHHEGESNHKEEIDGSRPRAYRPGIRLNAPPGGGGTFTPEWQTETAPKFNTHGGAGAPRDQRGDDHHRFYQQEEERPGKQRIEMDRPQEDSVARDSHRYYLAGDNRADRVPGKAQCEPAYGQRSGGMLQWD